MVNVSADDIGIITEVLILHGMAMRLRMHENIIIAKVCYESKAI